MTPERWQQIKGIFERAIERETAERRGFVDDACAGDGELRDEVESLLKEHERAGGFSVDTPAPAARPADHTATAATLIKVCSRCSARFEWDSSVCPYDGETLGDDLEALVGAVLDEKYRIERLLGAGGMGAVYLAMHLGTRRLVALKILAPRLVAVPEFSERFRREAIAAGRLRHPNIVNVTDFGSSSVGSMPVAFLVMEYLEGSTLTDALAANPRPPLDWIVDVVDQISLAVDEAHRHDVVHRDLKPGNIWLEPDRRGGYNVKVLDFGIAKLREPHAPSAVDEMAAERPGATVLSEAETRLDGGVGLDHEATTRELLARGPTPRNGAGDGLAPATAATIEAFGALTRRGAFLGTPYYMSPEQWRGGRVDARSDIYSLGVIAYQMFAGRPPFKGRIDKLLVQHLERKPKSLRRRRAAVPEAVEAVILSALAKDPRDRPTSAAAFGTMFRAGAEDRGELLKETIRLYGAHYSTFVLLSMLSGSVPLGVGLILGLLAGYTSYSTGAALLGVTVLLHLAGAVVYAGLLAPFVARRVRSPLERVSYGDALRLAGRSLVPVVTVCLSQVVVWLVIVVLFLVEMRLGHVLPSRGFEVVTLFEVLVVMVVIRMNAAMEMWYLASAVVVMEGLRGRRALARAKVLARRLTGPPAEPARERGVVRALESELLNYEHSRRHPLNAVWHLGSLVLVGLFFSATAVLAWREVLSTPSLNMVLLLLLGPLFGLAIVALVNPIVCVGHALGYLKARRLGGERIDEIVPPVDGDR